MLQCSSGRALLSLGCVVMTAVAYLTPKLSSCSRSSSVMRAPELRIFLMPVAFLPTAVRQLAERSRTVVSGSCTMTHHIRSASRDRAQVLAMLMGCTNSVATCNKIARADVMPHATHCSYENLELSSSWAARSAFCRISKSADLSCPICHNNQTS